MGYNTKNYTEQGGEKTVIGGTLEIKKCLRHFNSPSPSFMRGIRGFFFCHFGS